MQLEGRRQGGIWIFAVCWMATLLLLIVTPAVESIAAKWESVAMGMTFLSVLATVGLMVMTFASLRRASSEAVKRALSLGAMPACVALAIWMFGTDPNIHGIAVVGLYFNVVFGPLACVIVLLIVGVRSIWR